MTGWDVLGLGTRVVVIRIKVTMERDDDDDDDDGDDDVACRCWGLSKSADAQGTLGSSSTKHKLHMSPF